MNKALINCVGGILQAQKELFESHGYCLGRTKDSFEKDLLTFKSIKNNY